jgi:hypothetical protein
MCLHVVARSFPQGKERVRLEAIEPNSSSRVPAAVLHLPRAPLVFGVWSDPHGRCRVLRSSFSRVLPVFFRAQRRYNCEFAGGACTTAICRIFRVALDGVRKRACM